MKLEKLIHTHTFEYTQSAVYAQILQTGVHRQEKSDYSQTAVQHEEKGLSLPHIHIAVCQFESSFIFTLDHGGDILR